METLRDAAKSEGLLEDIKFFVMDFNFQSRISENIYSFYEMMALATEFPDPPRCEAPNEEAVGVLLWSSGTTSRAKAVKRTFKSFGNLLDPHYYAFKT